MEPTVWVALAGVVSLIVTTIVAPYVLRRADWARQDQVAGEVAKAAKLVADTALALKNADYKRNEVVKQDAEVIKQKLDVIHTLADGNLTAANDRLDRALKEIGDLKTLVADLQRRK